jgi:hypothetical protein
MWNPYLGIHMLSFARFVFTAALLVWSVSSGQADGGPKDLWSLYLREHAVGLCGRALTEEQETELDEAQHLARPADAFRSSGSLSPRKDRRRLGARRIVQQRRRPAD